MGYWIVYVYLAVVGGWATKMLYDCYNKYGELTVGDFVGASILSLFWPVVATYKVFRIIGIIGDVIFAYTVMNPILDRPLIKRSQNEAVPSYAATYKAAAVQTAAVQKEIETRPEGKSAPVIVCAALRYDKSILCAPRHYDHLMAQMWSKLGWPEEEKIEQGFVDQFGNFWNRQEALLIATNAGQVNTRRTKTNPTHKLFSEDLY